MDSQEYLESLYDSPVVLFSYYPGPKMLAYAEKANVRFYNSPVIKVFVWSGDLEPAEGRQMNIHISKREWEEILDSNPEIKSEYMLMEMIDAYRSPTEPRAGCLSNPGEV